MNDLFFIHESAFNRLGGSADPEIRLFSDEKLHEIRANADKWAGAGFAEANLKVDGATAIIGIQGVLLSSASLIDEMYARWFGEVYSTYGGLAAQIRAAENSPYIRDIKFKVDTPGGMVAGGDDLAQLIAKCDKPTTAEVNWMAASMGYYLASQCDKVVATNPTAGFGSIGTIVNLVDARERYEKMGVKFYSIRSSNAPRKNPEPHSDEFKEEIQARVDELAEIFVQRVVEGRTRATGKDVSKEDVEMNFGRGGLVLASAALAAGMIDAVEEANTTKEDNMSGDAEKAAFTQGQVDTAREEGAQKEKARVAALLPFMGADSDRVIKAIEDGEELGADLFKELNEAAVAKAREEALKEKAEQEETEEAEEAENREADEAPVVTGVDATSEEEDTQAEADALYAAAMKTSQIKGDK